jgi:8-oxo-dGTP diphosphatase
VGDNPIYSREKVFGEKLEGTVYIRRTGVYGIAFNKEGNIAVVKTPKGYFLPGGGIENEENHKECIKREFLEETGYEITIENYINKYSLYHTTKDNAYFYLIGFFYIVNLKQRSNYKTEEDHKLIWLEPSQCVKCLLLRHQSWAVSQALKHKV